MLKFNPDGSLIAETIKEYRCFVCGGTETYIRPKSQKPAWYFQRDEMGNVTSVYCLKCRNHKYRQAHLTEYKQYQKAYQKRPEVIARRKEKTSTPEALAKQRQYYHRPYVKEKIRKYCSLEEKKKMRAKNQAELRSRNKLKVVTYYSNCTNACACCGQNQSIKFLNLDHINGGGNKHRKSLGASGAGSQFYSWIIRNNYPEGYQILCWNCNMAKGLCGGCPHKTGEF